MLEARRLVKRYPGVVALGGVDFSVGSGEVVGLIGENGAGKSTLIKIMGGLVHPDEGELLLDGKPVRIGNVAEATRLGIALIHQELCNLTNLDIAANVFLGREPRKLGIFVDSREMRRRTKGYLERLGLKIDPRTSLSRLSIAQQQLVEIAKALSLEARILIMDEPTSSLTAGETKRLLEITSELRGQGVGIVYVSHRLDEVKAIADRVVAFRDGRNAGNLSREEITSENMVRLMVGRDLEPPLERPDCGEVPRLEVKQLRTRRYPQHSASFHVCEGEIVGIAGLVGAGRTELVQAIFGADKSLFGRVTLDGVPIRRNSLADSIRHGVYLVPEDRRHEGLITTMCIRENMSLPNLSRFSSLGFVRRKKEAAMANDLRAQLGIKAPSVEAEVRSLSGGNQQKVVLAKWLALNPKCLIFDEPTRGIDVGARAEIYALMRSLADRGVAILMVSSDMEEVLAVSDRILVMCEGKISGELRRRDATEEAVMKLAVGSA